MAKKKSLDPSLLGERELDLMDALWSLQGGNVHDVMTWLHARDSSVAYTTVQTMLNRLETKGYVKREREGRAFRYVPVLMRPAAQKSAINRVLKRFFGGSTGALAAHLVENQLSDRDAERIREVIDSYRRKRRKP